MTYNPNLTVPWGYTTAMRKLSTVNDVLLVHYHPEYVRRLLAWLTSMNGGIGIGGHFRPDGTQPDKPGFAPEGKSFHQNQQYNDGFIGATAVDVVAKNPTGGNHIGVRSAMVPMQGTERAKLWGVHANILTEPWHIQPVEIDGWLSWKNNGSPAPRRGYPLPGEPSCTVSRELVKGHTGNDVKCLQNRLKTHPIHPQPAVIVDGIFGSQTETAVKNYQNANGLNVDGKAGPVTLTHLGIWLAP
jgi:peptidoglycan hydrolase-like protein with peptidoglycan-binding domain